MTNTKKLTIEYRLKSDMEWFRIGVLEHSTHEEANKLIERVKGLHPSASGYEYRITENA